MSIVHKTSLAKKDFKKIWHFIANDSEKNADEYLYFLEEKCKLLANSPLIGRLREEFQPELRSFAVDKYLLFYRPIQNGIELVRILHGARDIEALL